MPQLADVRFETLRALGYAGASSDMLLSWLQDGGPAVGVPTGPLKTIPDAWRSVLIQLNEEEGFALAGPPPVLDDDFSEANKRVFVDRFDRDDPAPWVSTAATASIATDSTLEWVNDGTGRGSVTVETPVVQGRWYKVSLYFVPVNFECFICVNSDPNNTEVFASAPFNTEGVKEFYFQADVSGSRWIGCRLNNPAAGLTAKIDNVLIEEVPALEGWLSHNEAAIEIFGSALSVTSNGALQGTAYKQIDSLLTVGKTYIASAFIDATDGTFGDAALQVGSLPGTSDITPGSSVTFGNAETVYASFTAPAGDVLLRCFSATGTAFARLFDNITIQESLIANPTFDTDTTGWSALFGTFVSTAGEAVLTADVSASSARAYQSPEWVAGQSYVIQYDVTAVSSSSARMYVTPDTSTGSAYVSGPLISTPGTYYLPVTVQSATDNVLLTTTNAADGSSSTWDNVIVTEALPDSAYQRNDWWFNYLGSLGYTGQMNDRELAYWLDLFQSTTGQAYSAAYDSGYS